MTNRPNTRPARNAPKCLPPSLTCPEMSNRPMRVQQGSRWFLWALLVRVAMHYAQHMGAHQEGLMTEKELAAFLGLSLSSVKRLRASGDGPPFVRIGRAIRYDPEAVREWLRQREEG
jgi:predicted DNA-binding transcriptional regulator AlpA